MRFKLAIINTKADTSGTVSAEIVFHAGTWEGAGRTSERLARDLGMDGPSYSATLTYDDMTEDELKAREERRRQRFEPGFSGW